MTTNDESKLRVFERKVLRKIYGPLLIGYGEYRIRWNDELRKYSTQYPPGEAEEEKDLQT